MTRRSADVIREWPGVVLPSYPTLNRITVTTMLEPYRIDDFFNLDASSADDALFSLFLEDDFSKLPHSYDFPSTSPDDASSSTASHSPLPMFAIDPQLVGTPATSKALSDFGDDDRDSDDDLPPLPKPKPSRKGTVMSGGIKKAPLPEKENKEGKSKKDFASLKILEPEDWRPSPEEYKKMSSKEKRQLRNKISARNFRVRRKGLPFPLSLPRVISPLVSRIHHHPRGRHRGA